MVVHMFSLSYSTHDWGCDLKVVTLQEQSPLSNAFTAKVQDLVNVQLQ